MAATTFTIPELAEYAAAMQQAEDAMATARAAGSLTTGEDADPTCSETALEAAREACEACERALRLAPVAKAAMDAIKARGQSIVTEAAARHQEAERLSEGAAAASGAGGASDPSNPLKDPSSPEMQALRAQSRLLILRRHCAVPMSEVRGAVTAAERDLERARREMDASNLPGNVMPADVRNAAEARFKAFLAGGEPLRPLPASVVAGSPAAKRAMAEHGMTLAHGAMADSKADAVPHVALVNARHIAVVAGHHSQRCKDARKAVTDAEAALAEALESVRPIEAQLAIEREQMAEAEAVLARSHGILARKAMSGPSETDLAAVRARRAALEASESRNRAAREVVLASKRLREARNEANAPNMSAVEQLMRSAQSMRATAELSARVA